MGTEVLESEDVGQERKDGFNDLTVVSQPSPLRRGPSRVGIGSRRANDSGLIELVPMVRPSLSVEGRVSQINAVCPSSAGKRRTNGFERDMQATARFNVVMNGRRAQVNKTELTPAE